MDTPENQIIRSHDLFEIRTPNGSATLDFNLIKDEDLLKILIMRAETTGGDLQYLADLVSALGGAYVRRAEA